MKHLYSKIINKQKLLVINVYVEEIIELKKNDFSPKKEKIYFEFYNDYNRNEAIKMSLNTFDLRAISIAIKELLKKGNTDYTKITGGNSSEKKYLTLGISNEIYYLNASFKNLKIGITFNKYEFYSFGEYLEFLAEEIEKKLFSF